MVPGGDAVTYREKGSDGTILYAVDESVPWSRVVTRIADKSLPFGGTWTYDIESTTIDAYLTDLGRRLKSDAAITN